MEYSIRLAQKKDIDILNNMLIDIGILHKEGRSDIFSNNVIKYTNEQILDMLDDENNPIFVVVNSNDICVGYAFCNIKITKNAQILLDKKSLYIDDLCIDKSLRGNKIGSLLLDYIKSYAKSIDAYNIELNVWEFNKEAFKFYEKNGYSTQKRIMEIII